MDSKTKQKLKALAHSLKPVVIIGAQGVTTPVIHEIDNALTAHELIKVRVNAETKNDRQQMANQLCNELNATLVNLIGHVVTLYRKNPEEE